MAIITARQPKLSNEKRGTLLAYCVISVTSIMATNRKQVLGVNSVEVKTGSLHALYNGDCVTGTTHVIIFLVEFLM
jgi:hypothetical protein